MAHHAWCGSVRLAGGECNCPQRPPRPTVRPSRSLPPAWAEELRRAFLDLHASHRKLMLSEDVVRERRRAYRERLSRRAESDRRLKGKSREELRVIADGEAMRDYRTTEDIEDQVWMRARVGSLATYMKSVVLMHQLGLLPEEPPV